MEMNSDAEQIQKLLQEALSAVDSGATVVTLKASNKEELLEKFREALTKTEDDALDAAIRRAAEDMTPTSAAQMATVAAYQANREHSKGHVDCADFALKAADLWLRIAAELRAATQHELEIIDRINDEGAAPLLGLATTRELLSELEVRFEVSTPNSPARADVALMLQQLDQETLDYRTASGSGSDE